MERVNNDYLIERINQVRTSSGHSVSKMEELCGLPRGSTMDNWKRGSKPNLYAVMAIAKLYNVSLDFLVGCNEEKKPPADKQEAMVMAIAHELEQLTYDDLAEILHHVMTLKSQHDA